MSANTLVIYHAQCLDGSGAALAAFRKLGTQAEYVGAKHGEEPPDAKGRDVFILDFAYLPEPMTQLCATAQQVTVVDHHISAQERLADWAEAPANLQCHFNMEKSGAVLAWEYFHPAQPVPRLLQLIQDQDLWRFQYEETKTVLSGLAARDWEFAEWNTLLEAGEDGIQQLLVEGKSIERYRNRLIQDYVERAFEAEIAGFTIPVVNCPSAISSEVLNILTQGKPFAAGFQDKEGQRRWSLRSTDAGEDVSRIAGLFGGGGHRNASGFNQKLAFVPPVPPSS